MNPEVMGLESSVAKQFACTTKVNKKSCEYHLRVDSVMRTNTFLETDIENLADLRHAATNQK